jgi:hypothetical protein
MRNLLAKVSASAFEVCERKRKELQFESPSRKFVCFHSGASLNGGQTNASEVWEAIVQFVAAVWDSVELSMAFGITWTRLARGLASD